VTVAGEGVVVTLVGWDIATCDGTAVVTGGEVGRGDSAALATGRGECVGTGLLRGVGNAPVGDVVGDVVTAAIGRTSVPRYILAAIAAIEPAASKTSIAATTTL
jgi:hypothetical protein